MPRMKRQFGGSRFWGSSGKLAGKRRFCSYKVSKFEAVWYEMLVLELPTCPLAILWFCCGIAAPMWKTANPSAFEGFKRDCNVVLRGGRGA